MAWNRSLVREGATSFALNFSFARIPEPPIDNATFFHSLCAHGIWLRVLAAHDHVSALKQKLAGDVGRIASISGFYHQLGSHSEDIVSLLIGLAAWNMNPTLSMADILKSLVLRSGNKKAAGDQRANSLSQVKQLAEGQKRVFVDQHIFLRSLLSLTALEALKVLGIPWKKNPSAKLIPSWKKPAYDMFPIALRQMVEVHVRGAAGLLDASQNKIKHGPQIVVDNAHQCAERRGMKNEELPPGLPNRDLLRILFEGARTQEQEGELESGKRVAPFLLDDPE